MKTFTHMLLAAALTSAALMYAGESRDDKKQAAKSGPATVTSLPKGAEEVEPFLFRFKDPAGKVWMYRQTPFGLAKWEEGKLPAQPVVENASPIRVVDLGDKVRFEHTTPFGESHWERKKTDLNDEEKVLLKAHQNGSDKPAEKQ